MGVTSLPVEEEKTCTRLSANATSYLFVFFTIFLNHEHVIINYFLCDGREQALSSGVTTAEAIFRLLLPPVHGTFSTSSHPGSLSLGGGGLGGH